MAKAIPSVMRPSDLAKQIAARVIGGEWSHQDIEEVISSYIAPLEAENAELQRQLDRLKEAGHNVCCNARPNIAASESVDGDLLDDLRELVGMKRITPRDA